MKETQLLALSDKHLETILEWRNAPEVRKNMYTNHVITLEEHINWYQSTKKDKTKEYFVFLVNNEPCGVVGFTELNTVKGISSWAFYASPAAPRGTGSLMEFAALEYAFNTLKLHKLKCEVLGFNRPVVKLHQKFGFKIEGEHRDAYFDGLNYHSVIHLGVFASEWEEIREMMKAKLRM